MKNISSIVFVLLTFSITTAYADTVTVVSPEPISVTSEPAKSTTVTTDVNGNVINSSTTITTPSTYPYEQSTIVVPSSTVPSTTTTTIHDDGTATTTYERND